MWLNKTVYETIRAEVTAERMKREQAEQALAVERNNCDWLRTQVNTANFRADALFTQMTNARLPTPMIERGTVEKNVEEATEMTKGGALPSLEDPGDELATALGID